MKTKSSNRPRRSRQLRSKRARAKLRLERRIARDDDSSARVIHLIQVNKKGTQRLAA